MFWAEIWKISEFLSENFQFFGGEIFNILNRRVFVMEMRSREGASHAHWKTDWTERPKSLFSRRASFRLKHYENTPIQIYRKFHLENWKVSDKKNSYFSCFCSKHRLQVLKRTASAKLFNEYPQLCFWAEMRKIMYTPVNPSLLYKRGFKGVNHHENMSI